MLLRRCCSAITTASSSRCSAELSSLAYSAKDRSSESSSSSPFSPFSSNDAFSSSTSSSFSRSSFSSFLNSAVTTKSGRISSSNSSSCHRRHSSTTGDTTIKSHPLFLWIDPMQDAAEYDSNVIQATAATVTAAPLPILLPLAQQQYERRPRIPNVTTPEQALQIIHDHYSLDFFQHTGNNHQNNNDEQQRRQQHQQQFVGAMGEQDAGVAFCAIAHNHDNHTPEVDLLQYQTSFLQDTIQQIRQVRHGIPLTIYTSGLVVSDDNSDHNSDEWFQNKLSEIGMDVLQVSLVAGTPTEYAHITQRPPSDFGRVCNFVAQALEQQTSLLLSSSSFAVEVGVLAQYAASGRALALALGAQQVHVYESLSA